MSQEEEMLEVSPKELEFCFSQAARFGAFLQFLNENRPICRKIFEKHMGSDFNPNEALNLGDGRKKDAMMDIVHLFHKKGTPGFDVLVQVMELHKEGAVWDNVENFSALCHLTKKKFE